jgi:cytoskeletal protein CcmA (bactofilin family)
MSEDNKTAGSTTAIGPTIVIKGKLKSDEDLIVKGRIEAEISSTKALLIENSGIVKANIQVKSARISGVLVGNISAESRIEIASDGRVVGDMHSPRIVISDGAAFRGKIDMANFDAPREASAPGKSAAAPAPTPVLAAAAGGSPAEPTGRRSSSDKQS